MYLLVIGIIFAIMLGIGAGRLRKLAYGLGFWGTLSSVILGFIMFGFLRGIGFAVLLIAIGLVVWLFIQATGNARLNIEETNPQAIRAFGNKKVFTPQVAATECALTAMRDIDVLSKTLMFSPEIHEDDIMPSLSVYLKMVCTIILKRGSEVLPDGDKNAYGSAFRVALEAPLHKTGDKVDALAELLNDKWYKELTDNMDNTPLELASLTTSDIVPTLPLKLKSNELDYLSRFIEVRIQVLSESATKLRYQL